MPTQRRAAGSATQRRVRPGTAAEVNTSSASTDALVDAALLPGTPFVRPPGANICRRTVPGPAYEFRYFLKAPEVEAHAASGSVRMTILTSSPRPLSNAQRCASFLVVRLRRCRTGHRALVGRHRTRLTMSRASLQRPSMSDGAKENPLDAIENDPLCEATLDGSPEHRCTRPRHHDGLHRWRAPDGTKQFEWS